MDQQTVNTDYLEELLEFLAQIESYPHRPDEVKHIQTHISNIFIAPPFVYKIKKPVDFGFLDYSTLEKRHEFCRREVELNRRLSEGIYLGVIAIAKQGNKFVLEAEDETDQVVEYAVKMRKLPEEYFLHRYIEEDRLTNQHLDCVADVLADFYQSQEPDQEILKWGEVDKIRYNTDENFEQTEQFIGKTIDAHTYKAIEAFTDRYLNIHDELFEKRIEEKCIVDGHGDLHLDHIHITKDKVQIYDCIEFNDRFRYGDLAVDIAYLAMDLDFAECWQAERYFINRMAKKLDDPDLNQIVDFYKCYRAYVKGKVKSLQSTEEEVLKEDRENAAGLASKYFNLSLRYALLGSKPTALIFMGRVGAGKSTLSKHFAEKLNIDLFSSDVIRKDLVGLPLNERTPTSKRAGLYSREMSEKTYKTLFTEALKNLKEGRNVILDATFSSQPDRKKLSEMFEEAGFRFLYVEANAADEVIENRLRQRDQKSGVVSDARLEDFEKLSSAYDPPEEDNREYLVQVNTERPIDQTIKELYFKLVERNLRE